MKLKSNCYCSQYIYWHVHHKKFPKMHLLLLNVSFHLCSQNDSRTTPTYFHGISYWDSLSICRWLNFWLQSDNNNRQFKWKPTCVPAHISHVTHWTFIAKKKVSSSNHIKKLNKHFMPNMLSFLSLNVFEIPE